MGNPVRLFGIPWTTTGRTFDNGKERKKKESQSRPAWFKLFRHQKALIDSVPDESAGKAIKAVFQYFENGEVTPLSPLEFAAFSALMPYISESERMFENG